ncbi:cytochrome b N-terminal domain-containing protein [Streptomyces sp. NE06-03E]|uniref:cytochrome bc1 complex cytochrome b subunit n=1 Tax=unclassified Streptomyces TaxID=2593676 RepID=UPI0029BCB2CA|nr:MULTISPECIES: cytochrome b N-terminal domain-containing protein [unclassified Streptomyces]MDX3054312.1 cytochrome b N-terminal domain-containing protein [Streptomyces sp. NE06-03E]
MTRKLETVEPRRVKAGERVAAWAAVRLNRRGQGKSLRRRIFPDRWSFLLAEIALCAFVVLLLTGVFLSLYFHPSSEQVVYDGSYAPLRGLLVSEAFSSTLDITFGVRGGLLIRQVHHWSALILAASLLANLMWVFFTGAFRKPRELNWACAFLLLVLAMFAGLTGYDLPDDGLSGTGLAVVNGTILSVPIVGSYMSMFLFGGEFPGDDLVARFNTIHILIIPGLMASFFAALLFLSLRHQRPQYPGPGRTNSNIVGLPFAVYAVKSAGHFAMVVGLLFVLGATVQINPVWVYGPYHPDQVGAGAQPDWYMGVADGFLRIMPGWELDFWGHTLALDNFLPLLVGVGFFLVLGLYPALEAWVTGDSREHHLLDRPRNRPVRTALGAAWLSVYVVALVGWANDLIATHFHLSLDAVTWAVRIGLFAAPVLVYVVTKRTALGLQRRDREKILHGRETGMLTRLLHGEYSEVHEPLSQGQLYTLTQHEQYAPIAEAESDSCAAPSRKQVLRARLSRGFYGEATQILKPTAQEYEETDGRRH